jgi:hypothetical protein
VALSYTLNDGTNQWTANPFIASLTASTDSSHLPYACKFDRSTDETVCRERRSTTTTRTGSTTGSAQ